MLALDYNPRFWDDAARYDRWYEMRGIGLGDAFLEEVESALAGIEGNPLRSALITATSRQCQIDRFPFSIYYRIKTDRVRILALWHNSRGSNSWKTRR